MKKEKFQILVHNRLVEIDASEFAIFGYGIFIVHRDYSYPKKWTVSDPYSGMSVRSKLSTRKEAIQQATLTVCKFTEEEVKKYVRSAVRNITSEYNVKTRYEMANEEESKEEDVKSPSISG